MSGWIEYLAAWAAFLGAHLVPAMPPLRSRLIARLGRGGYVAGFSLLSVLLLLWLIWAAGRAPVLPLWDAGLAGRWLVNLAMPVAILLGMMAAGLSGLVLGFAIWSGAHLVANGDLAHVVLFGGMLVFALSGLLRSGLPRRFVPGWGRLAGAVALWLALLWLHPVVIGAWPLPG